MKNKFGVGLAAVFSFFKSVLAQPTGELIEIPVDRLKSEMISNLRNYSFLVGTVITLLIIAFLTILYYYRKKKLLSTKAKKKPSKKRR